MRLRTLLAATCFLAAAAAAYGQEAEPCRDFRFRVDTDPVLFAGNPAAIASFKGHISMAGIEFRKENGALMPLEGSPDSYRAAAVTESFISISDRISFHGKLEWSYFAGQKMGAQILIDPSFNPVNFLESTDANPGRKNKETYSLLGAMSYRFSDKWAAGMSIDYVSADQTKVKDPRFSNIWMDMYLKAGVSFCPSEKLMLGLSLLYRSTLEQVRGGIYGTTDKQYFILADKGGFYGTMSELSGDYNYIPVTTQRPMKNDFYGLGLQAVSGPVSNELELFYRQGYWGKRSSGTATYFEFSGIKAGYKGRLLAKSGNDLHKFSLDLGYELLGNDENIFKYVTPSGQNTRVEYSGQNHIFDRHAASAGLEYVWYKGTGGYLPAFTAGAAVKGVAVIGNTVLYPNYRNFDTEKLSADVFALKSIFSGRSIFTFGLNALFRAGFGTPNDDGSLVPASTSGHISFDNYLLRQFEYDTATAAGAGAEFRYTYIFSPRFAPYVRVSDDFSALLQAPQYLDGRFRNVALITLGCSF